MIRGGLRPEVVVGTDEQDDGAMAEIGSSFGELRERLTPRRRVITPVELTDLLLPHWVEEAEQGLAAPRTQVRCEMLLKKLPPVQRAVCALVAAEMVLPAWEVAQPDAKPVDGPPDAPIQFAPTAPRLALAAAWRLLAGSGSRRECRDASDAAWTRSRAAPVRCCVLAAEAATVLTKVGSTYDLIALEASVDAVGAAIESVFETATENVGPNSPHEVVARFLSWWWLRCRCRLAFADALTAELA